MKQPFALPLAAMVLCAGVSNPSQVDAFNMPSRRAETLPVQQNQPTYPLFQSSLQGARRNSVFRKIRGNGIAPRRSPIRLLRKLKKPVSVFCTALAIWFGAAAAKTPASHASTAAAQESSSSFLSAPIEKIVDQYVQEHMFDDDMYDPTESVYREAVGDKLQGAHPKTLSEITSSILGQDAGKAVKQASATGFGGILLKGINFLQRRGLSESMAIIVLTGSFVVAGPAAFLIVGMMVGAQSKRQINSVMKKRYGDTYTVDASIKVEEDVELDEDEDDEDEDVDDDEDEEDEDDEE